MNFQEETIDIVKQFIPDGDIVYDMMILNLDTPETEPWTRSLIARAAIKFLEEHGIPQGVYVGGDDDNDSDTGWNDFLSHLVTYEQTRFWKTEEDYIVVTIMYDGDIPVFGFGHEPDFDKPSMGYYTTSVDNLKVLQNKYNIIRHER